MIVSILFGRFLFFVYKQLCEIFLAFQTFIDSTTYSSRGHHDNVCQLVLYYYAWVLSAISDVLLNLRCHLHPSFIQNFWFLF